MHAVSPPSDSMSHGITDRWAPAVGQPSAGQRAMIRSALWTGLDTSPHGDTQRARVSLARLVPLFACLQEGAPGSSDQQQQPSPDQAPTSSSSSGGSTSTATDATGNPTIAGADSQQLQVSKEVIETLRNKVFGECPICRETLHCPKTAATSARQLSCQPGAAGSCSCTCARGATPVVATSAPDKDVARCVHAMRLPPRCLLLQALTPCGLPVWTTTNRTASFSRATCATRTRLQRTQR